MSLGVPAAQFPALGSPQVAGGRKKVQLTPGHSLMDWIRLGRNTPDLAGTGGRLLEVTKEELAKHNKKDDSWMVLRGRVYNVTPYMDFHPGGVEELMRGSGTDGTNLFDEVHKWVNFESMLEKCLVGKLSVETKAKSASTTRRPPPVLKANALAPPTPMAPPASLNSPSKQLPRYEWFQTDKLATIAVYTKWKAMRHENVIIDRQGRDLRITLMLEKYTFTVHIRLEYEVSEGYNVQVTRPSGKVEVILKKSNPGLSWSAIGQTLPDDKKFKLTKETDVVYRCCRLESVSHINHDTRLFGVALPEGCRMCVPTGHHVHLKQNVEGMEIVRSYTVVRPALGSKLQDDRVTNGTLFYLMIKIYSDGALTPQLAKLNLGDTLEVSSHTGTFQEEQLENITHLVLYAAGTGFTPMVNLIYDNIVSQPKNDRKVHLSFFNKTITDILWRDELQQLTDTTDSFEVRHILSRPDKEWTGLTGRIRKEILEGSIPRPGEKRKILFCACGPLPFTQEAIRLVKKLGYSDEMVHAFLA